MNKLTTNIIILKRNASLHLLYQTSIQPGARDHIKSNLGICKYCSFTKQSQSITLTRQLMCMQYLMQFFVIQITRLRPILQVFLDIIWKQERPTSVEENTEVSVASSYDCAGNNFSPIKGHSLFDEYCLKCLQLNCHTAAN